MKKGILTVVSGFSGAGKGTIIKELRKKYNYQLSISATTRQPRKGDVEGVDYFFKTRDEFEKMIEKNEDEIKIDSLTKRELQVLKELAVGKFNRDIAKEMEISERTVKNHISSIFKKLDVTDRTQAAVFAIKNDLIKIF